MKPNKYKPRTISIAPMMDWTDRHCRYFHRLLTQHTWLYTEMVTTGALLHGDVSRHLRFHESEHPVALQLGGCDPQELAQCAQLGQAWGYDEINLNCGCPSERVKRGAFGASLMTAPQLVADCIKAMTDAVSIDVTVKHRIGVDEYKSYAFLCDFVGQLSEAGCSIFVVHARLALLTGLSPKENRTIPPLCYDYVYRLKKDFPHLNIILNGGVSTYDEINAHLHHVDGVMIGRAAYHQPYLLAAFDQHYYGSHLPILSRADILAHMLPYIENELAVNKSHELKLSSFTRHMLGLMTGLPGAKIFRQMLSDPARLASRDPTLLMNAARQVVCSPF